MRANDPVMRAMTGDTLTFTLFFVGLIPVFGLYLTEKYGWNAAVAVPLLIVASAALALAAYAWGSLKGAALTATKLPALLVQPHYIISTCVLIAFVGAFVRLYAWQKEDRKDVNTAMFLLSYFVELNTALYLLTFSVMAWKDASAAGQVMSENPFAVSSTFGVWALVLLTRYFTGASHRNNPLG